MNVTVVGQGYVGLVTSAGAAEWGHEVIGVDKDPTRRDSLLAGRVPFHEPMLGELVAGNLANGRLRFTAEGVLPSVVELLVRPGDVPSLEVRLERP